MKKLRHGAKTYNPFFIRIQYPDLFKRARFVSHERALKKIALILILIHRYQNSTRISHPNGLLVIKPFTLLYLLGYFQCIHSSPMTNIDKRAAVPSDIADWAALGDDFASGYGAGWWVIRGQYNGSWAYQMN